MKEDYSLARNDNGSLYLFNSMPYKDDGEWRGRVLHAVHEDTLVSYKFVKDEPVLVRFNPVDMFEERLVFRYRQIRPCVSSLLIAQRLRLDYDKVLEALNEELDSHVVLGHDNKVKSYNLTFDNEIVSPVYMVYCEGFRKILLKCFTQSFYLYKLLEQYMRLSAVEDGEEDFDSVFAVIESDKVVFDYLIDVHGCKDVKSSWKNI